MRSLIVGRACNVWADVKAAFKACGHFDYIIVVNGAGCDYNGRIDHWVSYHSELFPGWLRKREANRLPTDGIKFWTNIDQRKPNAVDMGLGVRKVDCDGGSSGMVAVRVAMMLSSRQIVLAGIPMEDADGHYDQDGPWDEAVQHRKAWERDFDELKDRVRSVSGGWTQAKFGEPAQEWLHD